MALKKLPILLHFYYSIVYVYECMFCICGTLGSQKRTSDPLEL